jgi:hypothetical protein
MGDTDDALAVIRDGMDLYNRGEFEASIAMLPPEIEWDTSAAVPDGRVYRGRDDVLALWREIAGRWDEFRIEPNRWITGDGVVWMLGRMVARGAGSGVPIEGVWDQVWGVEGAVPVSCANYTDRDRSREAAGLSEDGA